MDVDYRQAFEHSPVAQAIARNRIIMACNRKFSEVFRGTIADLVGQSFQSFYPTQSDFEETGQRVGPFLTADGRFIDDRVMRRMDGDLFWVRVRGLSYTPESSHAHTHWVFTEIAEVERPGQSLRSSLTSRERDVAAQLIEGKTGKEIARALDISPRTVDVYRSRLLRKYNVTNTEALIQKLLQG
ncbi:LuxR family transcriptional regulator [Rhizobium sp. AU243]|uniref:LuxR family transcriptional regulator n=1 Tax=Rhizobium sp. AU243 TaxID=2303425 RepID=UPI0010CC63AA|nr:LuxR family transcriptional regulator [Rhizobium sp. AU243]TKV70777.1 PAS domain S-box protein [Rhizobium sp. AU243]